MKKGEKFPKDNHNFLKALDEALTFSVSEEGQKYHKAIEEKAKQIFEYKQRKEGLLRKTTNFTNIIEVLSGTVSLQTQYGNKIPLDGAFNFLNEDYTEGVVKDNLTQIHLANSSTTFNFVGSLPLLIGKDISLTIFAGEQKLLKYLAEVETGQRGNMSTEYYTEGPFYTKGINVPVIYMPRKLTLVEDILKLNAESFTATPFNRNIDFRVPTNYRTSVFISAGSRNFFDLDSLMDECKEEARKIIPHPLKK